MSYVILLIPHTFFTFTSELLKMKNSVRCKTKKRLIYCNCNDRKKIKNIKCESYLTHYINKKLKT